MIRVRGFMHQVGVEIKKLFRSKFFIICMALLMVMAIGMPILSNVLRSNTEDRYRPRDMDDLVVKGITITTDNPQYWDVRDLDEQLKHFRDNATTSVDDLRIDYFEALLDSKLETVNTITTYEDYRRQLLWQKDQMISDLFILDHLDVPMKELIEAIEYRMFKDSTEFEKEYKDLTPEQIEEKRTALSDKLVRVNKILIDNDYVEFFNLERDQKLENIKTNEERITALEKDIAENPAQEEMYDAQIKDLRRSNKMINEIDLPALQYCIEKNIEPTQDNWRYTAVQNKQSAQRSIVHTSEIMPESKFLEDDYLVRQYKTYQKYKEFIQTEIDGYNKKLFIAEKSLETDKPDMTYVPKGARKATVNFLWYSMAIAFLGAIIAGGLIAREFQTGTIRMLLIRPKTRTKIVLSKFTALMIISLGLYAVSMLLNLLTNGVMLGFSDLANPNYAVGNSGGIPFLIYYLPKFLICFVTILFACSVGYFLSVVTKITSLSVAIPLVCFVLSLLGMEFIAYRPSMQWVIYTPLPYINLAKLITQDFTRYSVQPIPAFGIPLMVGLSAIMVVVATMIFNKRDITN